MPRRQYSHGTSQYIVFIVHEKYRWALETDSSALRGYNLLSEYLTDQYATYLWILGCTAFIKASTSPWFVNLQTWFLKYQKSSSLYIAGMFTPCSDSLRACQSCIQVSNKYLLQWWILTAIMTAAKSLVKGGFQKYANLSFLIWNQVYLSHNIIMPL